MWHPDAIERQLAHAPRNKVRSAYNYAEHLPQEATHDPDVGRPFG